MAADLSTPWEQIGLVLAEAKRQRLPWNAAWQRAMRTLSPERMEGSDYMQFVASDLATERDLMKEIVPFWRAAYEGREVTIAEFDRMTKACEERLDGLFVGPYVPRQGQSAGARAHGAPVSPDTASAAASTT